MAWRTALWVLGHSLSYSKLHWEGIINTLGIILIIFIYFEYKILLSIALYIQTQMNIGKHTHKQVYIPCD